MLPNAMNSIPRQAYKVPSSNRISEHHSSCGPRSEPGVAAGTISSRAPHKDAAIAAPFVAKGIAQARLAQPARPVEITFTTAEGHLGHQKKSERVKPSLPAFPSPSKRMLPPRRQRPRPILQSLLSSAQLPE